MDVPPENVFDVLIIGAGISGINTAYRLQEQLPHLSYTILDGREESGGTWTFWKYPGLRSDSDLYTFGFPWRPWTSEKCIAEADLIIDYLRSSAEMYGIDKKMQFRHYVDSANWSSAEQCWHSNVTVGGEKTTAFRSRFIMFCTGYYDYKNPLPAEIPGISNFAGPVVHAQFWPEDLDYTDKNVCIIGSGATTVTLFPALAKKAKHVTMLQRSPSYVLAQESVDSMDSFIRRWSPARWQHQLLRAKWIFIGWFMVRLGLTFPWLVIWMLRKETVALLPPEIKHDPHFKPRYGPFEQRPCFCPDGDYYEALRAGKGTVITSTIRNITKDTIQLTDGQEIHPDIIVQATGLQVLAAGGARLTVDGKPWHFQDNFIWKNTMFQRLPNATYIIGYPDASWTLASDVTALLICRIIKKMEQEGKTVIVPTIEPGKDPKQVPLLRLSSNWVLKAKDILPKAGDAPQWRPRASYYRDWWETHYGDINTGAKYLGPVQSS